MGAARSADDWVKLAFETLASKGPDGVRVEPLARALKVTKGSFYWHFADRRALLDAVLKQWESVATGQIIVTLEKHGGTPASKLHRLMQLTGGHPTAPATEQAVRAWGVHDAKVRATLARVDQQRMGYVRDLLRGHGVDAKTAAVRSRLLYLALIGEFAWVAHGGPPSGPKLWAEAVEQSLRR